MALIVRSTFGPRLAGAAGLPWHVSDAVLRFRLELDPNQPQVPNVHLAQVRDAKHKWSGRYYKLDGKLYKEVRTMTCPYTTEYRCKKEFRHFVALVGLDERVEASASVVFEVFADKRSLYTSGPVTKHMAPLGICVRVPSGTKEVRLQTTGTDLKGRRWAYWANAGFLLKGQKPRVGYVRLFVPGYDPSRYEVALFTLNGYRVAEARLPTQEAGVIDVLFYGYYNHSVYSAYLVPKDKYEPPAKDWVPDAGLVLETRYSDAGSRTCEKLSGFRSAWQDATPVGLGLVTSVHHGYPVHPAVAGDREPPSQVQTALYRYTGFFEVPEAGEYRFATASNWGSYLLVDDALVVGWPGTHDYKAGRRCQKRKKISLEPGIHKLEYLNYNRPGKMLTMAAWKRPGEPFGIMTRGDFPASQGYVVTTVEARPSDDRQVPFEWQVVDDWRLDRDKEAFIRVAFQALPQAAEGEYVYRWQFDDGVTRQGTRIERLFLSPGQRRVTVQMLDGQRLLAETAQTFAVGTLTDKIWCEPRDRQAFAREIARLAIDRLLVRDIITFCRLADSFNELQWKDRAADALLARLNEWIGRREFQEFAFELTEYLCDARRKRYDDALRVYTILEKRTGEGSRMRQRAMMARAELLLRCFGKAEETLTLVRQARWERDSDKQTEDRLRMVRAEALIGIGSIDEARKVLSDLEDDQGDTDFRRGDIQHAGRVRHAAQLVRDQQDPAQLDHAMAMLDEVLQEAPTRLLSPIWNVVRLDVHLGRGEYRIARHLAERLANLDMTAYDRAQVLVRHVKALCGAKDVAAATIVYEKLAQLFPQSSEVLEARRTLTQILE